MLKPMDIHNKEFKRVMRGYDVEEVDEFLEISKELHNFVDPNFGNLNYIALINEIKNNKKE